jgi:hypothetical protein
MTGEANTSSGGVGRDHRPACQPVNGRYCIHGWHEGDDLTHDERAGVNEIKAAEAWVYSAFEESIPDD